MKPQAVPLLLITSIFFTPIFANDIFNPKIIMENPPMLTRKNYSDLPAPAGPYSIGVQHNNTLYLSGITAYGTSAQYKSIVEQTNAIFDQIKLVIQAEGISMNDLIKVTIYVTSLDEVAALRQVLNHQYDGSNPASSMVRVAELAAPGLNIEIEAIFALPLSEKTQNNKKINKE